MSAEQEKSADEKVAGHYGKPQLEEKILRAAAAAGKEPGKLSAADLAAVDEFHVGGLEATKELAGRMRLQRGMRVLDVGCGIGGPARYFAGEQGCSVSGIDLTEEFVNAAKGLTRAVGLEKEVEYRQANALALPYEAETFDRAYTIHVLMNVADKAGVFREVKRVLKPGGMLAIFDIMRMGEGTLQYPLPWAVNEETSFVGTLEEYRRALEEAGLRVEEVRDRREFSVEFTERTMARMAQSGPPSPNKPVLGLHLLMGEKTPAMLKNILGMMKSGVLTAVEVYAEKR
jgi:ubiquinone/menaquinone biosynthesis C-methylase UbiE